LTEIHFANAHVFPTSELRKHFPLQEGDVFDIARIREGIETLTRLYGARGYINFTASPDLRFDGEKKRISLAIDLNEDRQFRVASVNVFGLDRQFWGPTLRTKLVPGQVFNPELVEDVFTENKAVLPAVASSRDYTQITQDAKKTAVVIQFDFTRCN
jgi:outer membrane protein assembly factor BamA